MRKLMLFSVSMMVLTIAVNVWAMNVKTDPALVGLWLFDEGSGTVVKDSSGNGNNATINGDFKWDNGKFGKAIISPGAGSIDVPKSASLDTVTKAMTIAGWFRVDTDSDTGIRRQNAYLLEDQSSSEPVPDSWSFRVWNASGTISSGAYGKTKVVKGQWTHIAGTYDGAQMNLYINGVAEKELLTDGNAAFDGKFSGNIGTPADTLQLKYGSETLIGGIDEVVLFSRALSASEIKELMVGALSSTTAVDAKAKLATTWATIRR